MPFAAVASARRRNGDGLILLWNGAMGVACLSRATTVPHLDGPGMATLMAAFDLCLVTRPRLSGAGPRRLIWPIRSLWWDDASCSSAPTAPTYDGDAGITGNGGHQTPIHD